MSKRSHYDVLGVKRGASTAQIRTAHRRLARLLHPDHLVQVPLKPVDRARAERRIREVNEAWRILGDPAKRAHYDLTLPEPSETPLAPRPQAHYWDANRWSTSWDRAPEATAQPKPAPRSTARLIVPWRPLAIAGGLLLAFIVVLTLVIGPTSSTPNTPRKPFTEGDCVRIRSGPVSETVPCDEPNDGRIVSFSIDPAGCPAGSKVRRLEKNVTEIACVEPV